MDKLYRFPQGGATFACDLTTALKQVFLGCHPLNPLQADYDLLSLARDTITSLSPIPYWITGNKKEGSLA